MVEGAVVCAEKDPGFFATLRMTQRQSKAEALSGKIALLSPSLVSGDFRIR